MIPYSLSTIHLNLTPPQFVLGEWIDAGLILGLKWDPDSDQWIYLLETPEIEGHHWLAESEIDPQEDNLDT